MVLNIVLWGWFRIGGWAVLIGLGSVMVGGVGQRYAGEARDQTQFGLWPADGAGGGGVLGG